VSIRGGEERVSGDAPVECARKRLTMASRFRVDAHQVRDAAESRGVISAFCRIAEELGMLRPHWTRVPAPHREDEALNLTPGSGS
jgi:hypothetical protein